MDAITINSNPYIDSDLINHQNTEFSPYRNKQFEYKHTISLQSLSTTLEVFQ